ncbi:MAG: PAS domain S-box protein, partial [Pseudomonadota bacterium]
MWRTDALTSRITAAKTQWLRRGAIVLLGLLIAGVSVSSIRLYDELSKLSAADRDNVEWTLGQLDVDLLRFEASVKSVRLGDRTLADMRQHFDILYSRIRTISDGTAYGFLPKDDVSSGGTAALDAFLGRVTHLIDSPDNRLIAEIEILEAEVTALRPRARALTLNGLSKFTAEQMAQRERVVDTLMIAAVVGLTLITALAVSIVGLDRQRILLTRRSEQSDRIGNRLRATTNAALDAIVVADVTGTIVDWNAGAEAVFGIDRAAALGRRMTELIIPERFREAHDAGMERYRRTGVKKVIDAGRVELAALRGDGSEFPVELTIAAAESDDGPIFVSYLRDISPRLMAHEALTAARDAAQSAERAKSEFLAVMSHEMRTPLNGVLGVLDILARSDLDDRQRKFLQIA